MLARPDPIRRLWWILGITALLSFTHAWGEPRRPAVVSSVLEARINSSPDEIEVVWVFFRDRGFTDASRLRTAISKLPDPRLQLQRRPVRRHAPTELDLPPAALYVREVAGLAGRVRQRSKWLNAVSIEVRLGDLEAIAALPFVARIEPVGRRPPVQVPVSPGFREGAHRSAPLLDARAYGRSWTQLEQIGVPEIHARGYTGAGVVVAMFDSGFLSDHPSLRQLNVLAERDYVYGDDDVDPEPGDQAEAPRHGTLVWSSLGGYAPGELLGPAYGADFVLARSEDNRGEYPAEEDNYIAALEWADSLGADVVSSSTAYLTFAGEVGYGRAALDGETIPVSLAVDIAASRGIVVVNAASNTGPEAMTIWAPSDAHGVVSVGAVDADGGVMAWSSRGPTFDGRIKPEVVARGYWNWAADYQGDGYREASGTSLSTPLVGGCAALLVEAHPDWDASRVREALMLTADRANNPDNDYGHGLVNLPAALDLEPAAPPRKPLPFQLLEPADGDSASSAPVFRWQTAANPALEDHVVYSVILGTDSTLADAETFFVGADTSWVPEDEFIAARGGDLYWTVRAQNAQGYDRVPYFPFHLRTPPASPARPRRREPHPPDTVVAPDSTYASPPGDTPETTKGWWAGFNRGELSGPAYAMMLVPGDSAQVVVGGRFETASGSAARNVARWDGARWVGMDQGLVGSVRELVEFDGSIIAGGDFAIPGYDVSDLAYWTGEYWEPFLDWTQGPVRSLRFIDGILWAAGDDFLGSPHGAHWMTTWPSPPAPIRAFAIAPGDTVFASDRHVYRVRGGNWVRWLYTVSQETPAACGIQDLIFHKGRLWIAGSFTVGESARNIASIDASGALVPIEGGNPNGPVLELQIMNGELYALGDFTEFAGQAIAGIAVWDGATWRGVGEGLDGPVTCLVSRGEGLFAGGEFRNAGSTILDFTAIFENNRWQRPGQGLSTPDVFAFCVYQDRLIVAGSFSHAAGISVNGIAAWDGAHWTPMGTGANAEIWALEEHEGRLIAGGGFTEIDGVPALHVAAWNGSSWSPLGAGLDKSVFALLSHDDTLYAGGAFASSGRTPAQHVASWDGMNWSSMSEGLDSWVTDLETYQGTVIACGFFGRSGTDETGCVAKWSGTQWQSLDATMSVHESVMALTVCQGLLIAGGHFGHIGGVAASYVAGWDGHSWRPLGIGTSGMVYDVLGIGRELFVSGIYTYAGGLDTGKIARWDGLQWHFVGRGGPGGMGTYVSAMAEFHGSLYAGGSFERVLHEGPSHFIARYDGLEALVPVRLASFAATRKNASVVVSWKTASDAADILGFHVYRDVGGERTRLTESLLSGRREYEFVDVSAPAVPLEYRLEAFMRSGEQEWLGPVAVPPRVTPAVGPLHLAVSPNPLLSQTTLTFTLATAGLTRVRVFDASGRLVAIVHDGNLPAGDQVLAWRGRSRTGQPLPSGIYFLRLDTPRGSVSRKLVILR